MVGKSREKQVAYADAEVLLSAGAVQSPQILQLSGIGAPDDLTPHGIAVAHESKGVGANLQDHLDVCVSWTAKNLKTAYSANKGLNKLGVGMNYMFFGKGLGRQQFLESGAFLKSRPDLDRPDLQIHGVLAIMQDHGKVVVEKDGFTLHVCQLRPESRGKVGLRSADPFDDPTILGNYLATEEDRRAIREGVRIARETVAQAAFDPYRDAEYAPGADVKSDADLDAWIRAKAETIYHPVGTCRMGVAGDPLGGGRRPTSRTGRAGSARDRRLGDAHPDRRQHQCAHDHDRRARRRPDPRQGARRTAGCAGVRRRPCGGGRVR